jgi:hypothetical protein
MIAGPFETERQAADSVRHIYDIEPSAGAWTAANHRLLCGVLSDAGVELGAFDHQIVQWICWWEPSTVAVIRIWLGSWSAQPVSERSGCRS